MKFVAVKNFFLFFIDKPNDFEREIASFMRVSINRLDV